MRFRMMVLIPLLLAGSASAQIHLLSDEFNEPATLPNWQRFYATEGWPDRMRVVNISTTSTGHLYMEPTSTGWYNDLHAPFLFKVAEGDMVVEARIRSRGIAGELPATTYSLGGIFMRAPRAITKGTWTAGQEDWLFFSVGVGNDVNTYSFEDKTTNNSLSTLIVTAAPDSGFVRLRITRVGPVFTLDYRFPADPSWTTMRTFNRPDMPDTLQVGLTAYADWPTVGAFVGDPLTGNCQVLDVNADLRVYVDYIRFSRPPVSTSVATPATPNGAAAQNYPNPFNPTTTIDVTLEHPGNAAIVIYDVSGAMVARLDLGVREAGRHTVQWNGRNDQGRRVDSGVYFYQLEGASRSSAKKMTLLK